MDIEPVTQYLRELQTRITDTLQAIDGRARFETDQWQRESGGGGRSMVLRDGAVFEQAGVNFSEVYGANLPPSASAHRPELAGRNFRAMGVSLVVHPDNPYVPTSHANVRFFIAEKDGEAPIWWFGGGFDLTPYYGFDDDCRHWHPCTMVANTTTLPCRRDHYHHGGIHGDVQALLQGGDHCLQEIRICQGDVILPGRKSIPIKCKKINFS